MLAETRHISQRLAQHQAIAGPGYRDDPRNTRLIAWRTGRERGAIVSADGAVVARSDPSPFDPNLFRRVYPERHLYAHTVGYASVLFGSRGLEQAESDTLVSNRDATISGVLNAILGGDPRPRGIRLTIDHELQRVATQALGNQRGSVVAIDPATGAILASVSTPGFDANALIGVDAAASGESLEADPDLPLIDRSRERTFPPGSIFKVITVAAALESGIAGPSTSFADTQALELPGTTSVIRNYDRESCGDGESVTLERAVVRSCNTVLAALGMEIGAERLTATAEAFGFNESIPYELDVLVSVMPDAASYAADPAAVAQNAIGQRDVRATALQMALVAAAVANGGEIMIPHLVAETFTSDGVVETMTEPVLWRRAISPATAAVLTDLMEQVVTSGTGTRAAVPGIRIAGKTGTAEVTGAARHVWFIGFGPVESEPGIPAIAIAVVVESGGDGGETASGGSVAAPIAQAVFDAYLAR